MNPSFQSDPFSHPDPSIHKGVFSTSSSYTPAQQDVFEDEADLNDPDEQRLRELLEDGFDQDFNSAVLNEKNPSTDFFDRSVSSSNSNSSSEQLLRQVSSRNFIRNMTHHLWDQYSKSGNQATEPLSASNVAIEALDLEVNSPASSRPASETYYASLCAAQGIDPDSLQQYLKLVQRTDSYTAQPARNSRKSTIELDPTVARDRTSSIDHRSTAADPESVQQYLKLLQRQQKYSSKTQFANAEEEQMDERPLSIGVEEPPPLFGEVGLPMASGQLQVTGKRTHSKIDFGDKRDSCESSAPPVKKGASPAKGRRFEFVDESFSVANQTRQQDVPVFLSSYRTSMETVPPPPTGPPMCFEQFQPSAAHPPPTTISPSPKPVARTRSISFDGHSDNQNMVFSFTNPVLKWNNQTDMVMQRYTPTSWHSAQPRQKFD